GAEQELAAAPLVRELLGREQERRHAAAARDQHRGPGHLAREAAPERAEHVDALAGDEGGERPRAGADRLVEGGPPPPPRPAPTRAACGPRRRRSWDAAAAPARGPGAGAARTVRARGVPSRAAAAGRASGAPLPPRAGAPRWRSPAAMPRVAGGGRRAPG